MPATRKKAPPRAAELVANGAKPATKALKRRPKRQPAGVGFEDAARDAWKTWMLRRTSDTVAARESDLSHLGKWFKLVPEPAETLPFRAALEILSNDDPVLARTRFLEWVQDMETDGLAPTTIARRISTVRSWIQECHDNGLRWQVRIKTPKVDPYDRAEGPEAAKVEAVIADLEGKKDTLSLRDRAAILLLFDQALRRMSAWHLDLGHVRLKEMLVVVRMKNHDGPKKRTITKRTAAALKAWIHRRGRSPGPVFCPVWPDLDPTTRLSRQSFTNLTQRYKLGPSHGLRHSAATELKRRGADPYMIKALLGHRSLATTTIYLDGIADEPGRASRVLAGEEEIDDDCKT